LLFASALPTSGQTATGNPPSHQQAEQTYQKQIEQLENQIVTLRERVKASESAASNLETRVLKLELAQSNHESIEVDLTSRQYQRLDTETGTFLISVEDVSPYLDGYRVTLSIGNPSYATYKGFDLHAKWSGAYDWTKYSEASFKQWEASIREKSDSFPDSLDPGKWNKVDLLLPSTPASQLGYLQLSMVTNTISLITVK
jgi:hypothetical protein